MASDPARRVAYDVLRAVDEQAAYANLALADALGEAGLSARDAALATELVSGTLRLRGSYDPIIDSLVERALDPPVRDLLRLGAHQLLSMRIPDHAAISQTVDLTKRSVGHKPSGLVNAVLRRIAAHSLESWLRRVAPSPEADPIGHLAVAYSHPRWVVEALAEALAVPEELEALLAADNTAPRVHLVALPGRITADELRRAVTSAHPAAHPPVTPAHPQVGKFDGSVPQEVCKFDGSTAVVLEGGAPGALPAVQQGLARVQDAGSQFVALALAAAPVDGPDERWLDLCAGPGGKAALLAALAAQRGAHLSANEGAAHRARLVEQALRGFDNVEVLTGDGRRGGLGTFDRVLVDAPCSGLGALRRRPEARWRKHPEDLAELGVLQRGLLHAAVDACRPGGLVGYATCSPVVAETSAVVRDVLAQRTDVHLEPVDTDLVDARSAHLEGAVQLWPHRHGTDAMFLVLLRRE